MKHANLAWILGIALCACRSHGYNDYSSDREPHSPSDYGAGQTPGTPGKYAEATDADAARDTATWDGRRDGTPTTEVDASGIGGSRTGALSAADHRFVQEASQGGLCEVQASRVALQKNIGKGYLVFAQMTIDDHGRANRKLNEIARSRGVTPPEMLDAEHQGKIEILAGLNGDEFERRYYELELKAHDDAIKLFEEAARDCDDPELRTFAANTLPTLREHKQELVRLQEAAITSTSIR